MCALPKAAIFDLDGVLLDTEPLYSKATQSVVSEFGQTYTWAIKRRIMGGTAMHGAEIIVSELGLPITPAEYLAKRRRILLELFRQTVPVEGAEGLVRALSALGLPLGIATSSERSLFELKISRHPWFCLFSAVVCGDDPRILNPKPAPDIFRLTASELDVSITDCVIFEDSPAGVLGASASGARVVARRDPALSPEELASAHLIVENYSELDLPSTLVNLRPGNAKDASTIA
jgi:pseudouridine 5'-phosphatase